MHTTLRPSRHHILLLLLSVVLGTVLPGCGEFKEDQETSVSLGTDDSTVTVCILLDMSGSFAHMMADDGHAYQFALAVVDKYFRDSIGGNQKLIIGQISASEKFLLWQGTPLQLRQRFPDAAAFRDFLKQNANPNGSPIHDAIAHSLKYVMSETSKGKMAVFVLSDLLDTGGRQAKEDVRGILTTYAQAGGMLGVFYCADGLVTIWRNGLQKLGFQPGKYVVSSEIAERPLLPSFDG